MTTVTRMRNNAIASFDWPNLSWFPLLTPSIRIKEHLDDDRYTVRAELPGIDPEKDLKVARVGDELRIDVVRKESQSDKGRSEFHYGAFYGPSRCLRGPAGTPSPPATSTGFSRSPPPSDRPSRRRRRSRSRSRRAGSTDRTPGGSAYRIPGRTHVPANRVGERKKEAAR